MLASTRTAVLLACLAAFPARVTAQHSAQDSSRIEISGDIGAGMMRFGPQVAVGATIAAPRSPIGARFDVMLGLAPAHEVPGANFMAATAAGVWSPLGGSMTPYLLAGVVVSQSRHLAPALGAVAGTGVRFNVGTLRPYVEGRVQPRAGLTMLLGVAF